jgi:predicted AlkP superfamily phosphohydrolase/phosphomutase
MTPPKLTVLSIDGVPFGLLDDLMASGHMPAMSRLCERGAGRRMMRSVLPTVSNVAWTCYATGRNPGKHGIYGFIDRRAGTHEMVFPNASNLRGDNIWQILSAAGRKVFGMNVPGTYPPRAVNGVLIGGFLSPSAGKAAYPPEAGRFLEAIAYRVDSDAQLARQSKKAMLADLDATLAKRAEAMFHFLPEQAWDFFHVHVMGTDRINHFLLRAYVEKQPGLAEGFADYYRKVDDVIERLLAAIGDETPLMILSDHGFCPIIHEVQLSRYLVDAGWTKPLHNPTDPLSFDPAGTRAYTLIPGRIYVNLRGREKDGCVGPEEYEQVRAEVAADLVKLRDPRGRAVVKAVLKREQVYWPKGFTGPTDDPGAAALLPPYSQAPDLVAIPFDGYDLKLGLTAPEVFVNTQLEGMHTYHDAVLVTRNVPVPEGDFEIRRLAGTILDTLGVDAPADLDTEATPAPPGVV